MSDDQKQLLCQNRTWLFEKVSEKLSSRSAAIGQWFQQVRKTRRLELCLGSDLLLQFARSLRKMMDKAEDRQVREAILSDGRASVSKMRQCKIYLRFPELAVYHGIQPDSECTVEWTEGGVEDGRIYSLKEVLELYMGVLLKLCPASGFEYALPESVVSMYSVNIDKAYYSLEDLSREIHDQIGHVCDEVMDE